MVLTIGTGITAALGFAYVIYVQRTLGRNLSADFVAALSLVAFCQIALGPINGTTARFTAQFAVPRKLGKIRSLCRAMTARVAVFGLAGLAIGLLALKPLTVVGHFESWRSLLVAMLIVYATLILSVTRGVLRGLQAYGKLNLNTIVEAVLRLGLGIVFLQAAQSAQGGLAAYLAALLAILVVSRFQLRSLWPDDPAEPIHGSGIGRFTGLMFVVMFASAGFQNVDMLTVKHFFPTAEAGIYGAAFTLARMMGALATPFTILLLPLLTNLHGTKQPATGAFLRVASYFLALASIPLVFFGFWPDQVIDVLYSAEFAPAANVLFVLTVARLLTYLCHMLALIGVAAGAFGMLWVYLPGVLGQAVALVLWHDSLIQVAHGMIVGQAATMIALIGYYWMCGTRRRDGVAA